MSRKKYKKVTKSFVISAKVTPSAKKWLDVFAASHGMTRSNALAKLIEWVPEYLPKWMM